MLREHILPSDFGINTSLTAPDLYPLALNFITNSPNYFPISYSNIVKALSVWAWRPPCCSDNIYRQNSVYLFYIPLVG